MPGMNSGLNVSDPTVVAAFKSALLHQGLIALLIFGVLGVVWVSVREWLPSARAAALAAGPGEPRWRQTLRIGFGLLWVLDGVLQAQPAMPVGLPSQVIEPTARSSPGWVQHLVNWAGTSWSYHPIQAAAGAVWIQIGIGLWLLTARRGTLSRLAGVASVGWGLVVWVFGESFGGILAPGLSWLTGAPGSAALYVVAGGLVALPPRSWRSPWLGRALLAGTGAFLVGMAVLQAWPGRGFWQGSVRGQPGALTAMVQTMAGTSQPSTLSGLLSWFAGVVRADGFAVNLVAVAVPAGCGLALLTGRVRLVRGAVAVLAVAGLADWVLVQDLGVFGGLGTDPNSMIPLLLIVAAAWLVVDPVLAAEPVLAAVTVPATPGPRAGGRLADLAGALAGVSIRTLAAAGAAGVVLLGVVPMAAAQDSPDAAPILAQAIDGSTAPLGNTPAPDFTLTSQNGARISLGSLHGRVVLLTFLDPVCVSDCPLIAQEFRQAGAMLRAQGVRAELVAVNLNPLYSSVAYLQAFDRQERLTDVPDWLYLTGSPAQLRPVWKHYAVDSQTLPAGAMLGHSDTAYVITPDGRLTEELNLDPGPGTAATQSSFASELALAARQAGRER